MGDKDKVKALCNENDQLKRQPEALKKKLRATWRNKGKAVHRS